jgi:KDO2-lipid IV(A) lauroyltransferase
VVKNRLGERISYVERGENSAKAILRHLKNGNLFGALIDQDTNVSGVFAPFLGLPAFTPSAPIKIAMKNRSPVIPFLITLTPDNKHSITIEPEIIMADTGNKEKDIVENVTRCNNIISRWITQTPEQWVWMHERWNTQKKES